MHNLMDVAIIKYNVCFFVIYAHECKLMHKGFLQIDLRQINFTQFWHDDGDSNNNNYRMEYVHDKICTDSYYRCMLQHNKIGEIGGYMFLSDQFRSDQTIVL